MKVMKDGRMMHALATARTRTRRQPETDLPMLVRRQKARAENAAIKTYDVYLALRLRAMSPLRTEARLGAQELFISRLPALHTSRPGWSRAIEVRYLVEPANARNGWAERVQCFVVARVTGWGRTPLEVRRQATPSLRALR